MRLYISGRTSQDCLRIRALTVSAPPNAVAVLSILACVGMEEGHGDIAVMAFYAGGDVTISSFHREFVGLSPQSAW